MNIRVDIRSHKGHFNFANPSQESVNTYLAFHDRDTNTRLVCCNLETDHVVTVDPLGGVEQFRDWFDQQARNIRFTTAQPEIDACKAFVEEHTDDIERSMIETERARLARQQEDIAERLNRIDACLAVYATETASA